ncbi:MAG: peptidoglycan DD-metalloendopeptidase family protein [Actinomycetota bacterium]
MTVSRLGRRRTQVRMVGLCLAVAAVLNVVIVPVSSADTAGDKRNVDANIARMSAAIEGTSKDLARASLLLQRTKAELPGALKALTAAEAARLVAEADNQTLATAVAVAQADEAKAADALEKIALENQATRDQLGNLVRNNYQKGGVTGLSIALEATSPEDFTDRILMMDTVMQVRRTTLRGLDAMRAQGLAGQSHLLAVRRRVAALKIEAEAALVRATAARKAAAAAKTKLDLLYADQAEYEATVAAKKAAEVTKLNTLQAESDSLTRLLAAHAKAAREAAARAAAARRGSRSGGGTSRPPFQSPPGNSGGFLSFPVSGRVSQEFHPRGSSLGYHPGIDFAVNLGTPVYAAAAGEVIITSPDALSGGYGNRVIIDHGYVRGVDLTTTYNHLTRWVVSSGHVARGQIVGYSGNTGFSTGPHLHFEARENGEPVNPRLWF